MYNTPRTDRAYIVVGVKCEHDGGKSLVGTTKHYDDAVLQAQFMGKVAPLPRFLYATLIYNELSYGVFTIERCEGEPAVPVKDMGNKLRKHQVYVRRGSMNDEASPTDLRRIYASHTANQETVSPVTTFCLCIDLIESTEATTALTTAQADRFNVELVNQLKPHLSALGLNDSIVKFTGDGWLALVSAKRLPAISCLAVIMSKCFKKEMAMLTGLGEGNIPSLRISIGSGRDIRVMLPDGRTDSVGDAARTAIQIASSYEAFISEKLLVSNEVLIDYTVFTHIRRDFEVRAVIAGSLPMFGKRRKDHAPEPLYALYDIRSLAGSETAPEHFIYALEQIGKEPEARQVAEKAVDQLEVQSRVGVPEDKHILTIRWNKLIQSVGDFDGAVRIYKAMVDADVPRDLYTYNFLLKKARTYRVALDLFSALQNDGLQPNKYIYASMMARAPQSNWLEWLTRMRDEGVEPDLAIYNLAIKKSDKTGAIEFLQQMSAKGIHPDNYTFNTLISKSTYEEAKMWLEGMMKVGLSPDAITFRTLLQLAPTPEEKALWLGRLTAEGFVTNAGHDVRVYNILISDSRSYEDAYNWFSEMVRREIEPDRVTFNAMLTKASDFITAARLYQTMILEYKLLPDTWTFNILLGNADNPEDVEYTIHELLRHDSTPDDITFTVLGKKRFEYSVMRNLIGRLVTVTPNLNYQNFTPFIRMAASFTEALDLIEMMKERGVQATMETYTAAFSRGLADWEPLDLLRWYWAQEYHRAAAVDAIIAQYRKLNRSKEALIVASYYPHLSAAVAVMREHQEEALRIFKARVDADNANGDAHYSLGRLYELLKLTEKAKSEYQIALHLGCHEKTMDYIHTQLAGKFSVDQI